MTKQERIRKALEEKYYVMGNREGWGSGKYFSILNDGGKLKYTRDGSPIVQDSDDIKIMVPVPAEKWRLGIENEIK